MAFTYHCNSKTVTCVCGKEITGEHICGGVPKVEECTNKDCTTCQEKEKERLFEEQWFDDEDGYSRCSTCRDKCDCDLPKYCNCHAYIDIDGVKKCKSCDNPWGDLDTEWGRCDKCGYDGE